MMGIYLPAWSLPELITGCFCWAVWLIGLSLRPSDPETRQLVRSYRTVTLAVNLILSSLFLQHSGWVAADSALWWTYLFATTLPPIGMRYSRKLAGQPLAWLERMYWIISAGCALGLLLFPQAFVGGTQPNPYGFPQAIALLPGLVLALNQVIAVSWSLVERFKHHTYGPVRNFPVLFAAWMVINFSALLEQLSTSGWVSLPPTFWIGALALNLEFTRMIYQYQTLVLRNLGQAHQDLQHFAEGLEVRVKERTQALEHLALYDSLTHLANRSYVEQKLADELSKAQPFAVLVIDLDRFKQINDTAGHPVGDIALQEVSKRFAAQVPPHSLLARLGGDEFMVVLPQQLDLQSEAQSLSQQLLHSLTPPLKLGESDYFLGASIGIALFPQHGCDSSTLLRLADIAMYRAKAEGTGWRVFDTGLDAETTRRAMIEHALHQALEHDPSHSFHLEYQPIVEVATGKIVALEALLRWSKPPEVLGSVPPNELVLVAEESGLIVDLGNWILSEACHQMVRWQGQGLVQGQVSVNISVHQFERPDFVDTVRQTLEATGCLAEWLTLELLESALINRFEEAALHIRQLRALGVGLCLDDFGTGYSSLGYLHRLTFDALKIDGSFVQNLSQLNHPSTLVGAMLSIARTFKMRTVAEGVESRAQAAQLQALGCIYAQGWLYSKALPADQITALLRCPVDDRVPRARSGA